MAYNFSRGRQIVGDLSGSDDAGRNTGIDFEDDYIGFETSGSATMVVSGSKVGIGTTAPDYTLDVAGNIGVDQYIYHNGDADTLINFSDDKIILKAGNKAMVTMEEKGSAPHEVTINDGGNNIDFVVKGNGSNQGNPGMKFDASTNRLGINGVGTPSWELDVAGDIGLAEYIYHRTDTDTYIQFEDDIINFAAGGRTFIKLEEADQDKVIINPGVLNIDLKVGGENKANLIRTDAANDAINFGTGSSYGADAFFSVSGTIGSRGTATRGTAVFGGDVVVSGSFYARQRHITTSKYNSSNTNQQYVRFDSTGCNSTPGVNNKFLAPAGGKLLSVTIRCTTAGNGTNIAFHKASSGTANLSTSATETIGVDIASNNTAYQAEFTDTANFNAGDILGISIDPSSTPNDVNITCVWEFDFTD